MNNLTVRLYQKPDRDALRKIFLATAAHGESFKRFFRDGDWLADLMTLYYTQFEPDHCYVAVHHGDVIGYLAGASDSRRFRRVFAGRVLPRVVAGFFLNGVWKSGKNWAFLIESLKSVLKGEMKYPSSYFTRFPAHLHINVDKKFRGSGVGKKLLKVFVDQMKKENVAGVHARTARTEAHHPFFESAGFRIVGAHPLTLWTYLGDPVYHLITYGLDLEKSGS